MKKYEKNQMGKIISGERLKKGLVILTWTIKACADINNSRTDFRCSVVLIMKIKTELYSTSMTINIVV